MGYAPEGSDRELQVLIPICGNPRGQILTSTGTGGTRVPDPA